MSLYNNIFDAHAHYDDKWFDDDRFELLENIHTKGVCGIVNNAVDLETAKICIEYAEKYDFMYAAVGFSAKISKIFRAIILNSLHSFQNIKRLSQSAKQGLIIIGTFRKTCKSVFLRNRSGFLLTLKCRL